MENISEFLYLAFATALFCIGIYIFFLSFNEYMTVLENTREDFEDEYLVSETPLIDEEEEYYTRGYIMALLFEPLDYDIQIDNYQLCKHFHNKGRIKDYNLTKDFYEKQYIYDLEGNISKVKFIGK